MGSMDYTYGRMSWSQGLWTLLFLLLLQPILRTNRAVCLLLAMSNILGEDYSIEYCMVTPLFPLPSTNSETVLFQLPLGKVAYGYSNKKGKNK